VSRIRYDRLPTERVNPGSGKLDRLSAAQIARLMNHADRRAVRAVGRAAPALGRAVDLIVRALRQDPENGAYLDSLGWAYYRLHRLEEARAQLERAARLTGGDPVVLEHLGDVYKDLALKDLAKEQYRLSLAADPGNTRVQGKLEALH